MLILGKVNSVMFLCSLRDSVAKLCPVAKQLSRVDRVCVNV